MGNFTPDEALIEQADVEGRVLVTKDDDFVQSRLVRGRPRLLWLIATGNVDNRALEAMCARRCRRSSVRSKAMASSSWGKDA